LSRGPLARLVNRTRRLVRAAVPGLFLGGGAFLLASGSFSSEAARRGAALPIAYGVLLVALVGLRIIDRLRIAAPSALALRGRGAPTLPSLEARLDVELCASLLVSAYVVIALTGGLRSPLYALTYAMLAFAVTFHRRIVGLTAILFALGLERLLWHATPGDVDALALSHFGFLAFFALLHVVFLQAAVLRQRRAHRLELQRAVEALRAEARDFRLISASLSADPRQRSREHDEERLAIGAVETIHETLFYTLELLKESLALHTCVLLWLDDSGERLKIKELVTDSDCVSEVPLPADAGALGTVVKNRLLVTLRDPKRSHLPYYSGEPAVDSFIGVPVMEDGHLRGVLCADRAVGADGASHPFGPKDEQLLIGATEQLLRAIRSERVFATVERGKYEHERFFAALSQLNRALTAHQVCDETFRAVREFAEFDLAAISLFDKATRRHKVVATAGEVPKGLGEADFSDNAGLVSMVVKNRHFLPAGGELRDKDSLIWSKKLRLGNMESLLILPLIAADEAIGAFAVAAKRPRAFGKDKREMLSVLANHVAVSLANARMYGRMEEMATTDGLTGLVNHRTFQDRFTEMLARAERTSGKHALLLTDIDHFKKVNDTYGHPTGDAVLREVARVVQQCVRKIDLAARYGGEEFAIVLEATDHKGALMLAERIRAEVQKQVFQSDKGPFSVTLSLGIAVYPDDAQDKPGIVGLADQALYYAKHNGRNRAVAWPEAAGAGAPRKLKAVK
jgi:two-component system cell cycle response regulator